MWLERGIVSQAQCPFHIFIEENTMSDSVKERVKTLVATLNEALEDAEKFSDKGNLSLIHI